MENKSYNKFLLFLIIIEMIMEANCAVGSFNLGALPVVGEECGYVLFRDLAYGTAPSDDELEYNGGSNSKKKINLNQYASDNAFSISYYPIPFGEFDVDSVSPQQTNGASMNFGCVNIFRDYYFLVEIITPVTYQSQPTVASVTVSFNSGFAEEILTTTGGENNKWYFFTGSLLLGGAIDMYIHIDDGTTNCENGPNNACFGNCNNNDPDPNESICNYVRISFGTICILPTADCGSGSCNVNINTDSSNCGGCGIVCSNQLQNTVAPYSCSGGACTFGGCTSGWGNCDGITGNGCETPLNTDNNCGTCGGQCVLSHATSTCSSGSCQVLSCNSGWGDCTSSPGCETQLNSNTHCGDCNTPCSFTNALASCPTGVCVFNGCQSPYGDCVGNDNNCETALTSVTHCGGCNIVCSYSHATPTCIFSGSYRCEMGSCDAGWGNCDGTTTNGCETSLTTTSNCKTCGNQCSTFHATPSCGGSGCALTCEAGWGDCDGNVANGCETQLNTNTHCGACNNPCSLLHATESCSSGSCLITSCDANWGNCDVNAVNGCETDLRISVTHCGTCAIDCTAFGGASPSCVASTCTNYCPQGFLDCDSTLGCETPFSITNCGSCNNICSVPQATPLCDASGICVIGSCTFPYYDCNTIPGCETRTDNDPNHCGGCAACNLDHATASCSLSTCRVQSCDGLYRNCDTFDANGCELLATTADNCGDCGVICNLDNTNLHTCPYGSCEVSSCDAGWGNCDNNNVNGCEMDVTNSLVHCGACDVPCVADNATPTCASSTCSFECFINFGNCDGDAINGCEVNLLTDVEHCSVCHSLCDLDNAVAKCMNGKCLVQSCISPYLDCDGIPSNGCETDPRVDEDHCGECDKPCSKEGGSSTCSGGVCSIICTPPFGNCDANAYNGCEVNLDTDSGYCGDCGIACAITNEYCHNGECDIIVCPSGTANCDALAKTGCEIDSDNDVNNCGDCDIVCDLANVDVNLCVIGKCAIGTCDSNYGDCNGIASDGCEVDLRITALHCGLCTTPCITPNAVPRCAAGVCSISSCFSGFVDCDQALANGCEINQLTDVKNCGGCGKKCVLSNANPKCENGNCLVASCTSVFGDCNLSPVDGCEINLSSTVDHCGGCGDKCALTNAVPRCDSSTCQILSCIPPYDDCNNIDSDGCEVDLSNDNNHCGGCGKKCVLANANSQCISGSCEITSCVVGSNYNDCNANAKDGCESNQLTDVKNCGGCGKKCELDNANVHCSNGKCSILSCKDGYKDCDKITENGCEISIRTIVNCGDCDVKCDLKNALPRCDLSYQCVIESCDPLYGNCDGENDNGCETDLSISINDCGKCGETCGIEGAKAKCEGGVCKFIECNEGLGDCDRNLMKNGCESSLSTISYCGSCSTSCIGFDHAIATCDTSNYPNNVCKISACSSFYGDCDKDISNGCEVRLTSNNNHCGSCDTPCVLENAKSSCSSIGVCEIIQCNDGYANCDLITSNGCEVDLRNSLNNCGQCGSGCSSLGNTLSSICSSSSCQIISCSPLYGDCDEYSANGCEASLLSANHCGSCSRSCNLPHAISGCQFDSFSSTYSCVIKSCEERYADCDQDPSNGCEVNLNYDLDHCGGCDLKCDPKHTIDKRCSFGVCTILQCEYHWADCDQQIGNGCEVDLREGFNNCGECGRRCELANSISTCSPIDIPPTNPSLPSSLCLLTKCKEGFADCDGDHENGCEINLQTDDRNCGECDQLCDFPNSSSQCDQAICVINQCADGYGDCNGSIDDGCEVNLMEDKDHCGGCDQNCNFPSAITTCDQAICSFDQCTDGYSFCPIEGGEGGGEEEWGEECVLLSSNENCGECGKECSFPHSSSFCAVTNNGNECEIKECEEGYIDGDGEINNGCEVKINGNEEGPVVDLPTSRTATPSPALSRSITLEYILSPVDFTVTFTPSPRFGLLADGNNLNNSGADPLPPGESANKIIHSGGLGYAALLIGAFLMSCAIFFGLLFGVATNYKIKNKKDHLTNVIELQEENFQPAVTSPLWN